MTDTVTDEFEADEDDFDEMPEDEEVQAEEVTSPAPYPDGQEQDPEDDA